MDNTSYVRFIRGSLNNYKALSVKDENTLYFVYDEETGSSAIYLGSRLITGNGEITGASNLSELNDVFVSALADKDILVYDEENGQWNNISFEGLIANIKDNLGQTDIGVDENVFELAEDGTLKLIGFETAVAGTHLVKGADGKVEWKAEDTSVIDALRTDITNLTTELGETANEITALQTVLTDKADASSVYTKIETDTKIAEAIAEVDHLERTIVTSLSDVDLTAEDVDKFIYMIPAISATGDDHYDEYMVIDGGLEKVGSWEVDLSDYATKKSVEDLEVVVTNKADASDVATLKTKVDGIEEGAQVNIIDAVSEEFEINETKTLIIKSLDVSKIPNFIEHASIKAIRDDITDIKSRLDTQYATKSEVEQIQESITWEEI